MSGLSLIKETKNDVLNRKELQFELKFEGKATPSNAEVKKLVATKAKAEETLVVIKNIGQAFGFPHAVIEVFVYDTEEALKAVEKESKKEEKPEEKKEEPKAEAPKEEPKAEEKPAEEKKE